MRNGENDYYLVSAGAWTAYDADYLRKCAEDFMADGGGSIDIHDVTTQSVSYTHLDVYKRQAGAMDCAVGWGCIGRASDTTETDCSCHQK